MAIEDDLNAVGVARLIAHRVARIEQDVEQRLLDLGAVDARREAGFGELDLDADLGVERRAAHPQRAIDDLADALGAPLPRTAPGELHQLPDQLRRPVAGLAGIGEIGAQLEVRQQAHQDVVKLCARPEVSWPTASIFCDCRSCSSISRCSVISKTPPMNF